ncbi:MAG: cytochrome c peroxidase [Woeseiaceae bacterium]|nr:cytochrome c peroxidase [Woeseiaceae bacterium]
MKSIRKIRSADRVSELLVFVALWLTSAGAVAGPGFLPDPPTDSDYNDNGVPDPAKVELGAQLFFDKILSGNVNISCATCHHALTDTGDGLSLPVGEGGRGLGVTRDTGTAPDAIHERVPRNAPPVFNLGAREFTRLFHDGRLAVDNSHPSGFRSPAGDQLPAGLDSLLAAQAMFPVTSATEMAGQEGENPVADAAVAGDLPGVWAQLAERLQNIPEYAEQFAAVYEDVSAPEDITFVHVANAIAAFEGGAWRADSSPFDRYLRGDRGAMSFAAKRGMRVFYSPRRGNCASCHSGTFQTNHGFAAIAMPQIGPGKGDGANGREDFGLARETGNMADLFRFRVPTLRNVALTAPYGHAGAYASLEAVVRHHLNPIKSLWSYDPSQAVMPNRPDLDALDFQVMNDPVLVQAIAAANELSPVTLSKREFADLIEFLHALNDPSSIDLRGDVPTYLPSGNTLAE